MGVFKKINRGVSVGQYCWGFNQTLRRKKSTKGIAFSSDDIYQQEFDNDFPYVETEDQLRSIKRS